MAKRKETCELENALIKRCEEKGIYGCEEITIGFAHNGHGNEIVDFMTMDSKGIIKCYEIKVTIEDLKSKAKKSWYGHYNYLVVTYELYQKVENWEIYLPPQVGLLVDTGLCSYKNARKCKISAETESMLKESMIRSMYGKMTRYRDAQSIKKQKQLQKEIRDLKKENSNLTERARAAEKIISDYETYKCLNENLKDVNLQLMAREEKEKWRKEQKHSAK